MRRWNSIFAGAKYLIAGAFVAGGLMMTSDAVRADGMPAAARAPMMQIAPTTWSGVYFGVNSGWSWSSYDNTYSSTGAGSWSANSDDQIIGGQIGIQHQFGQVVVGLEGGLSATFGLRENAVQCSNTTSDVCEGRFNNVITLGPRIGWAMGKYMPYVTGGYANASFDHREVTAITGNPVVTAHERTNGWYIGAGVDMALAAGWTMGIEYRHYDFDDFASDRYAPGGILNVSRNATVDPDADTVTVRVSWKFDRPDRVAAPPLK